MTAAIRPEYRAQTDMIDVTLGPWSGKPDPIRRFIPGLTRYYRGDVEITAAEYYAALRARP